MFYAIDRRILARRSDCVFNQRGTIDRRVESTWTMPRPHPDRNRICAISLNTEQPFQLEVSASLCRDNAVGEDITNDAFVATIRFVSSDEKIAPPLAMALLEGLDLQLC